MTIGLYVAGTSPLHRLPPGLKLVALLAAGIGVFLVRDPVWLLPALAVLVAGYVLARIPARVAVRQLRPFAILFAVFFLVHGALTTWALGSLVVLRFMILVLAGLLVSLTTRTSDMLDALERGLAPFAALGINPAKVSLAFSLALRFIPLLYERAREVREAQQARGLERSFTALAVPLLVRTLRLAGDLTDAIEARGFDAETPAQGGQASGSRSRRRRS